MNKNMKDEQVPAWEEIDKRVVDAFDLDDVGANYGVARWREHVEKTRGVEDVGKIAHHFKSPKALNAVIEFFRSDIEENEAIFRVKVARNNRLLKLMNLRVALGEDQGVFVDEEDGDRVVPELLAVVHVTKAKMLQQIVQASNDPGSEQWGP